MTGHGDALLPPVDEAIVQAREGDLDGDTLLRTFAWHDGWFVPGRETGDGTAIGLIEKPGGGRILEVYSGREHLLRMERHHGSEFTDTILPLNGFDWMRQVEDLGVDRVNVNPGSPETIHYKSHQIAMIAAWGRLGRAEAALYFPDRVQDHLDALIAHEGYHVVIVDEEDGDGALMLAPDSEGRRLGAVFTTFATANDFANTLAQEAETALAPVAMPPERWIPLFQRLELDGIVFNAWSSLPTVALNRTILEPLAAHLGAGSTDGHVH